MMKITLNVGEPLTYFSNESADAFADRIAMGDMIKVRCVEGEIEFDVYLNSTLIVAFGDLID